MNRPSFHLSRHSSTQPNTPTTRLFQWAFGLDSYITSTRGTGFRLASNSAYIYYAYILSITSLDISWARFEAPRKTSCHLPGVFVEYSIYHLARKSPRFGYIVINVQQPPFNLIHTYLGQFYIVAPWIRGWLELHCGGQGPRLAYGNLRSCGYHPYATWDSGCLLCSRASPCHWSPYRRDHSCRTSWSGIACIQ